MVFVELWVRVLASRIVRRWIARWQRLAALHINLLLLRLVHHTRLLIACRHQPIAYYPNYAAPEHRRRTCLSDDEEDDMQDRSPAMT
jgi:hypothetical protein